MGRFIATDETRIQHGFFRVRFTLLAACTSFFIRVQSVFHPWLNRLFECFGRANDNLILNFQPVFRGTVLT